MVDPTLQEPELRLAVDEEALQPLHAGNGEQGLRHAEGRLPQDLRNDGGDVGAGQDHDDLYALGWTEHSVGSQNIRTMAMIQLLLGNMGMAGGGINALRGHANVQGITDMCLYSRSAAGLPVGADRCRRRSQDLSRPSARPRRCGRTR
jgi:hypothetical protein